MSIGLAVFLIGLFGVPLTLLTLAHRVRRRSPRVRGIFWGAAVGHVIAGTLAVVWGMIPPEAWTPEETARGFAGIWSLVLLPIGGAALGLLRSPKS